MLLAVLLLASVSVGNAAYSGQTISLGSRGEWGPDATFSGTTAIYGEQLSGEASNTLYVAAQAQGYGSIGGVEYSIGIGSGDWVQGTRTLNGNFHVHLDPSGPAATGCKGSGYLSQ